MPSASDDNVHENYGNMKSKSTQNTTALSIINYTSEFSPIRLNSKE